MQRTQRTLTSAKVAATLSKAGIPALGANKLTMLSREGNRFIREDGTAIRIFNVLAFRGITEQNAAVAAWKQGAKLEKAGDVEGAQDHFKAAYNQLMSFSVLEDNASQFEGLFEVAGIIEHVPAGADLQLAGIKTVLGFNRPRPVAITSNVTVTAGLFEVDTEDAPPVMPTGLTPAKQKAWKLANGVA